jgi:hypothetical protein
LAAGACAAKDAPSKAAAGKAQTAEKPKRPWWRLSQYSREPAALTPKEKFRRRPGLLSKDPDGFVLYRQGEAGGSPASDKPTKVRR